MNVLTLDAIDCCQRIGRDEANNNTMIGLPELDALCDAARFGIRATKSLQAVHKLVALLDEDDQRRFAEVCRKDSAPCFCGMHLATVESVDAKWSGSGI